MYIDTQKHTATHCKDQSFAQPTTTVHLVVGFQEPRPSNTGMHADGMSKYR